jgi:hypothetical protein
MEEKEKNVKEMENEDGATKKKKDIVIKIMADQIMHSGISVSKDGYKSARVFVKIADKEYMSVGYEWESEGVPDFVMSLMAFIQANQEEVDKSKVEKADEYKKEESEEDSEGE